VTTAPYAPGFWAPARTAFLIGILISTSVHGQRYMRTAYARDGYEMGKRLHALSRPGDLVITAAPAIGDPVAIHYSRRRGWVFPAGGGERDWSLLLDDHAATVELETLRNQGADWFATTKRARDSKGRLLIEQNRGLIAHLERNALKASTTTRC
jgi:hypothetical protein